ncbi:uncharacterized protein LOC122501193 [Leptopilina heterotoma]|uniref:uncharacterized protein LOC122501193 n=1 Tax=Leptopilina heterotoma TaxID=63436 RepID=UPI001CA8C725|nr:uncharacterized protein LOC122501193 [Leptopilina heterotoma]
MDACKKYRSIKRRLFTRTLTSFNDICKKPNSTDQEKKIAMHLLEARMTELEEVSSKYITMLFETDSSEEEIEHEIESNDDYQLQFLKVKFAYKELTLEHSSITTEQVGERNLTVPRVQKPFKKPILEIRKFSGNVGDWLQFWSHFRKVHEDDSISKEDKLEYLKQSVEKESKADNVVSGYPTSAENYSKAFESLKNRFGRDDLLVEFYTRELLNLVLQNASSHKVKVSVAKIYDKISAHIRALESLGVTTDKCATMLYPLVESSLPEEILRTWQRSISLSANTQTQDSQTNNRLSKLLEFLRSEVENEERIHMAVNGFGVFGEGVKKEKTKATKESAWSSREHPTASVLLTSDKPKKCVCIFCNGEHDSAVCEKAKRMSYEDRRNIIGKNKCCFKCIKRGHCAKDCRVRIICSECNGRHSVLLCPSMSNSNSVAKMDQGKTTSGSIQIKEQNLASFCNLPEVYLQTLRVILFSDSSEMSVRAVVDTGSQRSYITSRVAESLGYKSVGSKEIVHSLFGGERTKSEVHNIYLARVKNCTGTYACNFQVMNQDVICNNIPCVKQANWMFELEKRNIQLCDYNPNSQKGEDSIDMLIGADVIGKLMTGNKFDCSNGLTAFETNLGWTIMGRVPDNNNREDFTMTALSMFVQEAKVSDLWSLDTIGIKDPIEKLNRIEKDKQVKENFLNTVKLKENDRYVVCLPWIDDHASVASNFNIAKIRLENLKKKLISEDLFEKYSNVIYEWLDEGIVELVPENEIEKEAHYLPHRHVVKLESNTVIRPVFDASSSEKGYPALNQCLEKGPNLIELIPTSLLRLRKNEIAVVADIRKAFLQIEVNEEDRDFLRFLWFKDGEMRIFRHRRVVFGLTCSPFLLGAVLELHLCNMLRAVREKFFENDWSEETILKLNDAFYVDNCTTSVNSIEELKVFIKDSKEILSKGGFDLRNWEYTNDNAKKDSTLVLGILYNKKRDTILINPTVLNIDLEKVVTKRTILSAANKVFDPMGFVSPVTLIPKLILKRLWRLKNEWDVPVDEETRDEFIKWSNLLYYLNRIEIPRKFGNGNWSIHMFCDASKLAYAVVVFLRIERTEGVELRFVSSKTRVAPEKTTIPRLELLAATIGSRLTNEVVRALNCENVPIIYWSDATTVLAWIKRDMQWNTFVNNRVREIRELTKLGTWRHVPGEKNPADLPSRGCDAKQLFDSRWWEGPAWLRDNEKNWPQDKFTIDESEVKTELKKTAQVSMVTLNEKENIDIVGKFSSYNKLIRFFAIMLRFKNFKLGIGSEKDGKHEAVKLIIRETHESMCHAGVQSVMCQLRERFWILSMRRTVKAVISKCITCKRFNAKNVETIPASLPIHRVRDANVFEITGVDFAGPVYLRGNQKGWICLFTCAVYRAIHLELVTSLSTQAFLCCFRRFISRRGRPTIMYSDNGLNFVGANNILKTINWDYINKYSSAKQIQWRFNPPSAPWWGGWWERLIGMLKNLLRRVLGKSCLTFEELLTVLCDCESVLNARPLTYMSESADDLKVLTPAMFLHEIKETCTPDIDIASQVDLTSKYKRKQEIVEHLRKRFRNEYLGQLTARSKSKKCSTVQIGDIVIIGDDNHKRIDWPLGKIEKMFVGRDGNVRVVMLKTKEGRLKRPVQRIYPLEISQKKVVPSILGYSREKLWEKIAGKR